MQVHRRTESTPFDLVLTRHPLSITLPGPADRPGITALDKRLTPVQYRRAVAQWLRYAMERARHKQIPAQKRYKKNLDKKTRLRIEVQQAD